MRFCVVMLLVALASACGENALLAPDPISETPQAQPVERPASAPIVVALPAQSATDAPVASSGTGSAVFPLSGSAFLACSNPRAENVGAGYVIWSMDWVATAPITVTKSVFIRPDIGLVVGGVGGYGTSGTISLKVGGHQAGETYTGTLRVNSEEAYAPCTGEAEISI